MRRTIPYLLALTLGAGTALLAACGGGTPGGVPSAVAGDLKSQIEDVREATEDSRCSDLPGQLRQVDEAIDDLPASTDAQIVSALSDGVAKLRRIAVEECEANRTAPDPTETTTTETTPTTELPPTETTEPTETTTLPEEPPPVEPPPPPPPPPDPEPVPDPLEPVPPAPPGGGIAPEVEP
ncbi:MAG: hypothetical protein Q8O56_08835 [Solirubrobacteraceae bacterium]|nr:hypothetical protein [Solirubrobacteraceae bacterium]